MSDVILKGLTTIQDAVDKMSPEEVHLRFELSQHKKENEQLKQQLSLMGCEFAEYEKTKKELLRATDKLGAVLVKMEGENPNYQSIYDELFEMWEALRK